MIPPPTAPDQPLAHDRARHAVLMEKARALEAAFLSEMLSFSGLGAAPEGFGGGPGEEQFASFLRHEQAQLMVQQGGLGLAEQIFRSLVTREGKPHDTA